MTAESKNVEIDRKGTPDKSGYPVVILENDLTPEIWRRIRQVCREREWQVLDIAWSGNVLPELTVRIAPRGVVTRQSTDVLAVQDPHVASALRFIWEHYNTDVTLDQVAEAAGVSRRTLTMRFRSVLGRTVLQVIRSRRLDCAVALLRTSKLSVADIAAQAGYR